jgi:hypothetical protein
MYLGSIEVTQAQAVSAVNAAFKSLFGRTPAPSGLNFWVNALVSGQVTLANLDTQMLATASSADLAYYNAHSGAAMAPAPLPTPTPPALPVATSVVPVPAPIGVKTPAPAPGIAPAGTYKNSLGQTVQGTDYGAQIKQFYSQVGLPAPSGTAIDSWNDELNTGMNLTEVQSLIGENAEGIAAGAINAANTSGGTAAQVAAATAAGVAAQNQAAQYVSSTYSGAPVSATQTPVIATTKAGGVSLPTASGSSATSAPSVINPVTAQSTPAQAVIPSIPTASGSNVTSAPLSPSQSYSAAAGASTPTPAPSSIGLGAIALAGAALYFLTR